MRTITTLAIALALLVAPTAVAQDSGYETTVTDDRATIEVERSIDGQIARTSVVFDTSEGVLAADNEGFDATDHALNLSLHQILEYEDTNENDRFDGDDKVYSAYRVANASENRTIESNGTLQWEPLEEGTVQSENGTEGTRVVGQAQFPPADPVEGVLGQVAPMENRTLTVALTVFGQPVTYEGQQLGATEVAVTTHVENYPYRNNGTQPALVSDAHGTPDPTIAPENATDVRVEKDVEVASVSLAYDWADNATVDDEETPVHAGLFTVDEGDDESLALSYERGDDIVHQASIGAHYEAADDGEIADAARDTFDEVPAPAALTALAALAGVAALARRTRG